MRITHWIQRKQNEISFHLLPDFLLNYHVIIVRVIKIHALIQCIFFYATLHNKTDGSIKCHCC